MSKFKILSNKPAQSFSTILSETGATNKQAIWEAAIRNSDTRYIATQINSGAKSISDIFAQYPSPSSEEHGCPLDLLEDSVAYHNKFEALLSACYKALAGNPDACLDMLTLAFSNTNSILLDGSFEPFVTKAYADLVATNQQNLQAIFNKLNLPTDVYRSYWRSHSTSSQTYKSWHLGFAIQLTLDCISHYKASDHPDSQQLITSIKNWLTKVLQGGNKSTSIQVFNQVLGNHPEEMSLRQWLSSH